MKKIFLILMILLLLTGCRNNNPATDFTSAPTEPEVPAFSIEIGAEALDIAMAAAKESDEEETIAEPAYISELDSRVTWTVLSVAEADSETARAKVKVTAPDLYSVIRSLENSTFSSTEEMDRAVTAGLRNAPLREREMILDFQTDGQRWEALLSEEFTDACYGGLLTYRDEMYAAMEGE